MGTNQPTLDPEGTLGPYAPSTLHVEPGMWIFFKAYFFPLLQIK